MSQIFASISVRLKVILAFAAVLTCTIGLGLFAIERLEAVNANAQEIKANYLPATRVLGRIAQIAERFRQNRASMLLATTDEQRVQVVSTMKEQTQTYAREREAYQPLILSGKERRWSDAFDAAWKRYLEIDDSIVGLVGQGKHGEAVELFRGGATKAMAVYRDALQGGIELNVRQGTQAADMGAKLGASANRWILAVLGLATMLCIGVGWTIVNGVSSPIGAMTTAMCRLAEGDLAVEITCGGRGDEIGAMAKAVEVFKQNAAEHRHLEAEQKQQEVRARREKQAALIGMAEKIEAETGAAVESVGSQTAVIAAAAEEMSASSTRTGEAAQGAASAAGQALANAQTVASAAEQLAASIREIGGQMSLSTAVVGRAVAAGGEARATIEALNTQVGRIGEVANMISDIAARTNLLALNATIEAARAGDAGRGFAVVANEVKQLATQTARSTREITRHIGEVRAATDASVTAVGRIEKTIGEIDAIASSIAAAVEQQGAATAEIARNVGETAEAANEMTRRIGEVSAEAERNGRRSAQVRDGTAGLNNLVGELKRSVIRVVRTSATEVDRRRDVRYPVNLTCRVAVDGRGTQPASVVDLSVGGALITDGPVLPTGSRGMLDVDRIGMKLPFIVRGANGGSLHLAFDLDAASSGRLAQMLEHLAVQRAA